MRLWEMLPGTHDGSEGALRVALSLALGLRGRSEAPAGQPGKRPNGPGNPGHGQPGPSVQSYHLAAFGTAGVGHVQGTGPSNRLPRRVELAYVPGCCPPPAAFPLCARKLAAPGRPDPGGCGQPTHQRIRKTTSLPPGFRLDKPGRCGRLRWCGWNRRCQPRGLPGAIGLHAGCPGLRPAKSLPPLPTNLCLTELWRRVHWSRNTPRNSPTLPIGFPSATACWRRLPTPWPWSSAGKRAGRCTPLVLPRRPGNACWCCPDPSMTLVVRGPIDCLPRGPRLFRGFLI